MIKRLILMIVSMSIIFCKDTDDVVATVEAIDKAWVEEKPNDVFENIHKDNTVFWDNSGWLGNYGSAKGWVCWFSKNDFTWKVRDRDVKVYGNTAVVATIATGSTTKEGSETKVFQVRETNVLSKINNKWVLVHTHSSKFEPKNDD